MPPTYVFVLDVSFAAVSGGLLRAACAAIKACLDRLPGEDRTRVAILTFDRCVCGGGCGSGIVVVLGWGREGQGRWVRSRMGSCGAV